jgi:hypothetical protein
MDTSTYPQSTVIPGPAELPARGPGTAADHQKLMAPTPTKPFNLLTESDPFWGNDHGILFRFSRLAECFPTPDQTLQERLNSVSRLALYIGLALSIFQRRPLPFQISTLILIFIYFAWKTQTVAPKQQSAAVERFDSGPRKCTMPSEDNPMMNLLPGDPMDRGEACVGPEAEERARAYLNPDLYKDVEELFSNRLQQQIYTLPVTTVVNDRAKFGNWLYRPADEWGTDPADEDEQPDFNVDTKGPPPAPDVDLRRQRQYTPDDMKYNRQAMNFPELRV